MRAEARRPRRRTIALTSLIDVIFILLLFFLLSSTFSRFGELSLATATSDTGARNADTAPVFLRLGADGVTVNGAAQTLDTLLPALEGVASRDDGDVLVLVSVGPEVSSQRLVDLLFLLRPLGWADVSVLD
jgi:biopolymer transport protein ExbD